MSRVTNYSVKDNIRGSIVRKPIVPNRSDILIALELMGKAQETGTEAINELTSRENILAQFAMTSYIPGFPNAGMYARAYTQLKTALKFFKDLDINNLGSLGSMTQKVPGESFADRFERLFEELGTLSVGWGAPTKVENWRKNPYLDYNNDVISDGVACAMQDWQTRQRIRGHVVVSNWTGSSYGYIIEPLSQIPLQGTFDLPIDGDDWMLRNMFMGEVPRPNLPHPDIPLPPYPWIYFLNPNPMGIIRLQEMMVDLLVTAEKFMNQILELIEESKEGTE